MNKRLRLLLALCFLAGVFGHFRPVAAQEAENGVIHLSTPQTDLFPSVHFYLDAYGRDGSFLNNLLPGDLVLLENGQQVPVESIEKIENSLQVILAVNTSPQLAAAKDGVTEFQRIQAVLEAWARALPPEREDDFSLTTPTGLHLIRSKSTEDLAQSILSYQPDLTQEQPPLNSLAEALDMATDPLESPLMKRAILYITPPLTEASNASLPDMAARAQQIGVRVSVWLMAPAGGSNPEAEGALRGLVEATGGKFFQVAQGEPLPDVETAFEALRSTYQVRYTSAVQQSGRQSLEVQVKRSADRMALGETAFEVTVLPPNPIFLSPPAAIERSWNLPENEQESILQPESVPLQILIEFPDQHERAITATRLYVNNTVVAENLSAPFDSFTWSLADITTSERSTLRVEAVDALNLTGTSADLTVDVTIATPAQKNLLQQISGQGMVAVGAVAASGIALGLVLFLTNTQRRLQWKRQLADKKRMKDPVTQPVPITPVRSKKERSSQPKKEKSAPARPAWPVRSWPHSSAEAAGARLVSLDDAEQPVTGAVITISRQEITFGNDPRRATQVLNSATVDGLHARLYRGEDDVYYLADNNSIAGSWINYAPVTESGARLEHGDLIHIGKVMFRFELNDPARQAKAEIKVTVLD